MNHMTSTGPAQYFNFQEPEGTELSDQVKLRVSTWQLRQRLESILEEIKRRQSLEKAQDNQATGGRKPTTKLSSPRLPYTLPHCVPRAASGLPAISTSCSTRRTSSSSATLSMEGPSKRNRVHEWQSEPHQQPNSYHQQPNTHHQLPKPMDQQPIHQLQPNPHHQQPKPQQQLKPNHHHHHQPSMDSHKTIPEACQIESSLKVIKKEKLEVPRQNKHVNTQEERKVKKIMTDIASRVSAASRLSSPRDTSPVTTIRLPPPIATSTPLIKSSRPTRTDTARFLPTSFEALQSWQGEMERGELVIPDEPVVDRPNLVELLKIREAKKNIVRSSESGRRESLQGAAGKMKRKEGVYKVGRENVVQSALTQLPVPHTQSHLLPEAGRRMISRSQAHHCGILSKVAINLGEKAQDKGPVNRRLFGSNMTNTLFMMR